LAGSAESIPILKKIQNGVVLVKKKKKKSTRRVNRVTDRVLPGQPVESIGSHRVMAYAIFSSTRPGSSPGSAGSRVDPPGRAGFQNTGLSVWLSLASPSITLKHRFSIIFILAQVILIGWLPSWYHWMAFKQNISSISVGVTTWRIIAPLMISSC
jgi:hypothetical protein